MKNKGFALLAVVVLASCSTPRYSYYFDHQTYPVRKNQTLVEPVSLSDLSTQLTASVSSKPVSFAETQTTAAVPLVRKTALQLSKTERKVLRHQLKKEVKNNLVARKELNSTQAVKASGMDQDLKLATIFGAIGIVGLILNSVTIAFGIIGGIALIIGIIFFVKWIIRQ